MLESLDGRIRFVTYILVTAVISLILVFGMMIYIAAGTASRDEISEDEQIELFMYTDSHPHLRAAYTRANSDGVITPDERDEIMNGIKRAMRRGLKSGENAPL